MKLRNHSGFTLIESVLLLFVVLMLTSLPTIFGKDVYKKMESVLFIEEFQSYLLSVQTYAILMNETTQIIIKENQIIDCVILKKPDSSFSKRLILPKEVMPSSSYTINFIGGTGRPSSIQTIEFTDRDKTYHFTFQMGSGRYIFKEIL